MFSSFLATHSMVNLFTVSALQIVTSASLFIRLTYSSLATYACPGGKPVRQKKPGRLIAPHRIRARCSCRIFCHTYKGLLFFLFDHMCTDLAKKPVEMRWLSSIRMVSQPECQNTTCHISPTSFYTVQNISSQERQGVSQYCRGLLG